MTTSFLGEVLQGLHNFTTGTGNTFKAALYLASGTLNASTTAYSATNEITDMMQRMRELAVQAVNDTNDNAQRSYLDLEFQQLKQQIVQIADNTEWNGFSLLNGKARTRSKPVWR